MRTISRSLTTVALAATLAATFGAVNASPAQAAAPDSTNVVVPAPAGQAEAVAFADVIRKLEPSVVRAADGTLTLATTATEAGVAQAAFDQVKASMEVTNEGVRAGKLRTTADLQVRSTVFTAQHNGVIVRWWGSELHLNGYWTQRLEAAFTAASIPALIRAALGLTVSAALGWAGVIGALGVVAILVCSNDNGVKFYRPHVGPPWCTGH